MKIHNSKDKLIRTTFGVVGTLGLAGILGIGIYNAANIANISNANALSYSTSKDISFTFAPTLSIGLSTDSLTIDNLVPGTTSDSNKVSVTVSSNTPYGYVLSAGVGSTVSTDPYYNTSDLVHDNSATQVPTTNKFSSIATTASLESLNTDNTWGYSTSIDGGTSWSTYSGLSNTATKPLLDVSDPATPSTIDFRIAARSAATQASGTYNNVITFYVVGKPEPVVLYDEVAKMSKGTQTATDLQAVITSPTSRDYHKDTSNSGVYEYNSAVFGESSDASNVNKIYYYRGVLEPAMDQGSYGSDGKATTYPNYVRLGNDTCWRIVRTTGSGGVKMVYNGTWTGATCANKQYNAQVSVQKFASQGSSQQSTTWARNIHYAGYTFNDSVTDSTTNTSVDIVFGNDANPSLNNTRSNIKVYIEDAWYANNMTDYTNILEPSAGYCNDRTTYSNDTTSTFQTIIAPYVNSDIITYFGAYGRNRNATNAGKTPLLACPRSTVDLYRYVADSTGVGNELKYPAALLTADEASFAGSGRSGSSFNAKSYLISGRNFWLLSPGMRKVITSEFTLLFSGQLSYDRVDDRNGSSYGVRPAISLKPGTTVASGSGTAIDPWVVPAP